MRALVVRPDTPPDSSNLSGSSFVFAWSILAAWSIPRRHPKRSCRSARTPVVRIASAFAGRSRRSRRGLKPADQFRMSIKTEVALWRAFLGDEIDTILRDRD